MSKEIDFKVFKPFIKELIACYYNMDGKGAGGYLHIVLDDGNIDWESINFCQEECEKYNDTFGYFLCDVLHEFYQNELQDLYEKDFWGMHK